MVRDFMDPFFGWWVVNNIPLCSRVVSLGYKQWEVMTTDLLVGHVGVVGTKEQMYGMK